MSMRRRQQTGSTGCAAAGHRTSDARGLLERWIGWLAASSVAFGLATTARTEGVCDEPRAPVALLMGYGDSSLNFVMRVWTNDIGNWMNIRSAILTAVLADLDAAGISIPYPQRDVHVRTWPEHLDKPLNQPRGA
jgi:hypothetical protein